jgi:drug/metabolite transporter (DMT)-like permease
MGVLLAIASAVIFGASDLSGASRHTALLRALFWVQLVGFLGAGVLWLGDHPTHVPWDDFGKGSVIGVTGVLGAGIFYAGIQRGAVSVVAPLSALGTALVPLTYALINGERPGTLALVGAALAMAAIALISREPGGERGSVAGGALFGVGAGLGWGASLTVLSTVSAHAGFTPLLASRLTGAMVVGLALFVRRVPPLAPEMPWRLIVFGGFGDISANALQLVAFRHGLTSVVAPITALYPASTVILARVLLKEQIGRSRVIGLLVAVGGITLLGSR